MLKLLRNVACVDRTEAPAELVELVDAISDVCDGHDYEQIHNALHTLLVNMLVEGFDCSYAEACRLMLQMAQKSVEKFSHGGTTGLVN